MIKVGDSVVLVKSPYLAVRKGTISKVTEIRKNHFGNGKHLYVLGKLSHKNYWEHELEKVK